MTIREACKALGIEVGCPFGDVKKAYKGAAKKAHPDVGGSDEAMRRVIDAYNTILDSIKRGTFESGSTEYKNTESGFSSPYGNMKSKTTYSHTNTYSQYKRCKTADEIRWATENLIKTGRARDIDDVWVTMDGRVLCIKEMATSHIANCITHMQKRGIHNSILYTTIYNRMKVQLASRTAKVTKEGKITVNFGG